MKIDDNSIIASLDGSWCRSAVVFASTSIMPVSLLRLSNGLWTLGQLRGLRGRPGLLNVAAERKWANFQFTFIAGKIDTRPIAAPSGGGHSVWGGCYFGAAASDAVELRFGFRLLQGEQSQIGQLSIWRDSKVQTCDKNSAPPFSELRVAVICMLWFCHGPSDHQV
jgi:hypothetical protein